MAHWTNLEVRRLREAHEAGEPSRAQLSEMFPRHSSKSTLVMIWTLGISRDKWRKDHCLRWLKIAHGHFARREAGLLV